MHGACTTRTPGPSAFGKTVEQMLRARHGAAQAVAHPHGDGRRRRLALLHHVEMGIEGRDLVDLGQRKLHLLRQRGEMRGRDVPVMVLDQVQVLDQQVAPPRPVGKQRLHLGERVGLDLTAFRGAAGASTAASRSGNCAGI